MAHLINLSHNAKLAIHGNNGLTIGEQQNAIQNFYNPLLTAFRHMSYLSISFTKCESPICEAMWEAVGGHVGGRGRPNLDSHSLPRPPTWLPTDSLT